VAVAAEPRLDATLVENLVAFPRANLDEKKTRGVRAQIE